LTLRRIRPIVGAGGLSVTEEEDMGLDERAASLHGLAGLMLALGILAHPAVTVAQVPARTFHVGHLSTGARSPDGAPPVALREGLRELGYVEGRNVLYETRFAEGHTERLPALAAELVGLKVDVIVAQGGPAGRAARQATASVPIVIAPAAGDLVAVGLISSLSRPGGNVTGLTDESVQLSAKRMELLKETVPKASHIAVLEKAARILHLEVEPFGVRSPDDFPRAFSTMGRNRPDALFLVADGLTTANRKQVIDFAAANHVPAMYETSVIVRDGGLMSYGPDQGEGFQHAARFVDRILRGARPAELPAEQPTRY
jgi:ABC-type uncharacterized transport system substrate-binding protein